MTPVAGAAPAMINDAEFEKLQGLIERESGIFLSEAKRALLVGRLGKRLRALGLSSFAQYHRYLVEGNDPDEWVRMIDCVCTNETHFFREPKHFAFLEEQVFPRWHAEAATGKRSRRIRIWSAACSTGEEPFTLAMLLAQHFPAAFGWDCEVFATDLSTRALDAAKTATWSIDRVHEIPPRFLKRFMLRGTDSQLGKMRARPEVRALVRFARMNLNAEHLHAPGPFDLVFCRNVLIYFRAARKARLVERLRDHLTPSGLLFLGHAETVNGARAALRTVIPTVYACR